MRQVRQQQGQGPSGGQWFCFDDITVEPWDVGKLDAECFGGKESQSRAAQGLPQSPRPLGVCLPGPIFMHSAWALPPLLCLPEWSSDLCPASPHQAAENGESEANSSAIKSCH